MKKYLLVSIVFIAIISTLGCSNNSINHTHSYINGKCSCGSVDENYVIPHTHIYIDGVCNCGSIDENYIKKINITFVKDIYTYNVIVEKATTITKSMLPEEYCDDLVIFYYDKEYTKRYNLEKLEEDTTLYITNINTKDVYKITLDKSYIKGMMYLSYYYNYTFLPYHYILEDEDALYIFDKYFCNVSITSNIDVITYVNRHLSKDYYYTLTFMNNKNEKMFSIKILDCGIVCITIDGTEYVSLTHINTTDLLLQKEIEELGKE